jgi:hypothetical protein
MSTNCDQFLSEVCNGSGKQSPELARHLLTCPECRSNVEAVKKLCHHSAPISIEEKSEISRIVNSPEILAMFAGASASTGSITSLKYSAGFKYIAATAIIGLSVSLALIAIRVDHAKKTGSSTAAVSRSNDQEKAESDQNTAIIQTVIDFSSTKNINALKKLVSTLQEKCKSDNDLQARELLEKAQKALAMASQTFQAAEAAAKTGNKVFHQRYVESNHDLQVFLAQNPVLTRQLLELTTGATAVKPPDAVLPSTGETEEPFSSDSPK